MKGKIPKRAKHAVKEWLKFEDKLDCPFHYPLYRDRSWACKNICAIWFPRVSSISKDCPCQLYALKTVVKRAREMIKGDENDTR